MLANEYDRMKTKALEDIHQVRLAGLETKWNINHGSLHEGFLQLDHKDLGTKITPVAADMPEGFLTSTMVKGLPAELKQGLSLSEQYRNANLEDLLKKHPLHLVVLNQTDGDLILACQIGAEYTWVPPTRSGSFMPFLWKLSKQQLIEILD